MEGCILQEQHRPLLWTPTQKKKEQDRKLGEKGLGNWGIFGEDGKSQGIYGGFSVGVSMGVREYGEGNIWG